MSGVSINSTLLAITPSQVIQFVSAMNAWMYVDKPVSATPGSSECRGNIAEAAKEIIHIKIKLSNSGSRVRIVAGFF